MTVNILGRGTVPRGLRVGETCELNPERIRLGSVEIELDAAVEYRTSLLRRREVVLPGVEMLTKGVAMLKTLYDASAHGPTLPSDSLFRAFVDATLTRYAAEGSGKVPEFGDFLDLIGRGAGFTPAGDDFVSGFTATYNYIARCNEAKGIAVPRGLVASRTVPESAAIVAYSARGYVDEGLEKLILSTTVGGRGSFEDLEAMAPRGHTSGMDMALGVLLAESCISDASDRGKALRSCLRALWP